MLYCHNYPVWAHDLFLQLVQSVQDPTFQLEVNHIKMSTQKCLHVVNRLQVLLYVLHQSGTLSKAGNKHTLVHDIQDQGQVSSWILHSLVSHIVHHDSHTCSLITEHNRLLAHVRSCVARELEETLGTQDDKHLLYPEWEIKIHFLVATYVEVCTAESSVLLSTVNTFLVSQDVGKQYIGTMVLILICF